jgi:type IX secretion system PorP/SprF family membrane protein
MFNYIKNRIRSVKHIRLLACILLIVLFVTKDAKAQLSGLQSVYFQNQYLANPAMAGLEKGLNLNIGYQQQWTTVPGGPKLQDFTADYYATEKVGLGMNVTNDQAGLISRTRIMGTYAYHLPLGDFDKLSFGLSFGVNDSYLDKNKIIGNQNDIAVQNFNQQNVYIDGDFGAAYNGKRLTIQGALPNLRSIFYTSDAENLSVDRATFYSAVSYKFPVSNEFNTFVVEPKVAFRGVKGFPNMVDAGFNLALTEYNLDFTALYHSNQSATLGFGLDLEDMGLFFAYTNNTGELRTYANNTFEVGIKVRMFAPKYSK